MTGTLVPTPIQTVLDNNGNPVSGAKVFTYSSGTSTKLTTYSEATLTTPNSNPIICDSAGRYTAYLSPVSYKFVAAPSTDTDPPASPYWTADPVASVPLTNVNLDITGVAGQDLAANDSVVLSDGSGGNTAGRWYKSDADFNYLSSTAKASGFATSAISNGASGSIRRSGQVTGLSGLTAGTVYYASSTAGAITSTPPALALVVGVADSTTSLVIPGLLPDANATTGGLVNIGAQTFGGVKTFTSPVLTTPTITTPTITNATISYAALPTGIGALVYSVASSNFVKNNNTTLGDVTGLSFSVAANATYLFTLYMSSDASVAAGNKFDFTGPAAPTTLRITWRSYGSTNSVTAFSTSTNSAGQGVGNLELTVFAGYLVNGANAGTVQFRYAQFAADATNATVYASSYIQVWRVA